VRLLFRSYDGGACRFTATIDIQATTPAIPSFRHVMLPSSNNAALTVSVIGKTGRIVIRNTGGGYRDNTRLVIFPWPPFKTIFRNFRGTYKTEITAFTSVHNCETFGINDVRKFSYRYKI